MPDDEPPWEDDTGPMVRAYTITSGRTRATAFDRIATVSTVEMDLTPQSRVGLQSEHLAVLALCRRPTGLAEVAARLTLPLNVVCVLLDDLLSRQLIAVSNPVPGQQTDAGTLRDVLHGLQAL